MLSTKHWSWLLFLMIYDGGQCIYCWHCARRYRVQSSSMVLVGVWDKEASNLNKRRRVYVMLCSTATLPHWQHSSQRQRSPQRIPLSSSYYNDYQTKPISTLLPSFPLFLSINKRTSTRRRIQLSHHNKWSKLRPYKISWWTCCDEDEGHASDYHGWLSEVRFMCGLE